MTMSWHTLDYWKKGLIIGVLLNLILALLYILLTAVTSTAPFFLVANPLRLGSLLFGWGDIANLTAFKIYFSLFVLGTMYYGVVGALVGKIIERVIVYQRFKSKEKN